MTVLSVNLNKVAVLRNSRGGDEPDLLRAVQAATRDLVGAYALAAHGYPRATMDIDFWIQPSPDNATAVLRAIRRFGAPLQGRGGGVDGHRQP